MIRVHFDNKIKNDLVPLATLNLGELFVVPFNPSDLKMVSHKIGGKVHFLRMNCTGDQGYLYGDTRVVHIKNVEIIVKDPIIFHP